jgi:hypothetical protein
LGKKGLDFFHARSNVWDWGVGQNKLECLSFGAGLFLKWGLESTLQVHKWYLSDICKEGVSSSGSK